MPMHLVVNKYVFLLQLHATGRPSAVQLLKIQMYTNICERKLPVFRKKQLMLKKHVIFFFTFFLACQGCLMLCDKSVERKLLTHCCKKEQETPLIACPQCQETIQVLNYFFANILLCAVVVFVKLCN